MKTILHRFLGSSNTPQDIKDLRNQSFDFHEELGFPVVFKHRWTEKDHREGLVEKCPLHDDVYGADKTACPICFGTGFVGGYKDAEIVYVSISDAPTDAIKITEQGFLTFDQHPQITAPWIPYMQDGDLLVTATFDPETWEIVDIGDRYELEVIDQITIRGPGYNRTGRGAIGKPWTVHQEGQVDKLPYRHHLYDVPLVFDPAAVDPDIWPDDEDPNLDPTGPGTFTSFSTGVRIRGAEQHYGSSHEQTIKIAVAGSPNTTERGISIVGEGDGVDFHW